MRPREGATGGLVCVRRERLEACVIHACSKSHAHCVSCVERHCGRTEALAAPAAPCQLKHSSSRVRWSRRRNACACPSSEARSASLHSPAHTQFTPLDSTPADQARAGATRPAYPTQRKPFERDRCRRLRARYVGRSGSANVCIHNVSQVGTAHTPLTRFQQSVRRGGPFRA